MSQTSFRLSFRAIISGFHSGALTYGSAYSQASSLIETELTKAFHEGFVKGGIYPSELLPEEQNKIQAYIYDQIDYLPGFLDAIQQAEKTAPLFNRLELWINRYREAVNLGFLWAKGNPKVEWKLGSTEEHCRSCLRASGKVKRKSQFEDYGLIPQSPNLECGGWRCDCRLEKTDKPMSMGPLPKP